MKTESPLERPESPWTDAIPVPVYVNQRDVQRRRVQGRDPLTNISKENHGRQNRHIAVAIPDNPAAVQLVTEG